MQYLKWYFLFLGAVFLYADVVWTAASNNRFEICVKYHTPKECVDIK